MESGNNFSRLGDSCIASAHRDLGNRVPSLTNAGGSFALVSHLSTGARGEEGSTGGRGEEGSMGARGEEERRGREIRLSIRMRVGGSAKSKGAPVAPTRSTRGMNCMKPEPC